MRRNGKDKNEEKDMATTGAAKAPLPGSTKPAAISRENAEHYRWGDNCDAWYLVKDKELHIIEEVMPPGAAEIRHHHKHAQQFFFVLVGEIIMEIEGETILIPAGSGIRVLPGKRHQVRNPSSSPVRLLVVSNPPSHGDRHND
jgi:mannose-6-phosphate isomerase-like protein (cupin superfamily)